MTAGALAVKQVRIGDGGDVHYRSWFGASNVIFTFGAVTST